MRPERRLKITELAHNGSGIGFIGDAGNERGKVVFVPGALPGQTVSWLPVREKKGFIEAELCAVEAESPLLLPPVCAHSHECGACPLQRLPYDSQLYWKQHLAREALVRIGGLERQTVQEAWREICPSRKLREHRNKIELAFGADEKGSLGLGFRGRKSHTVFPVKNCALLDTPARTLVTAVAACASCSGASPGYFRHLVLRKSRTLEAPGVAWHCLLITGADKKSRKAARKMGEALLSAGAGSFVHEERIRRGLVARGDRRVFGIGADGGQAPALAMELGGKLFEFGHGSFFQVNSAGAEDMALLIGALAPHGGSMLDLYCGVGAPGQLLSAGHDRCLGIEIDKGAVALAARNASRNGLPGRSYRACAVEAGLAQAEVAAQRWELVLMDPPRSGLEASAVAGVMRIAPQEIIYVSCNPATLARDARSLGCDYELVALHPVDMFPHTIHLECISHWRRKV